MAPRLLNCQAILHRHRFAPIGAAIPLCNTSEMSTHANPSAAGALIDVQPMTLPINAAERAHARHADQARAHDVSNARLGFLAARSPETLARRVLLVGTGRLAAHALHDLNGSRGHVVGVIDSTPQAGWSKRLPNLPLLGGFDDVRRTVLDRCVDEIHVALPVKSCFGWYAPLEATGRELGIPVSFHVAVVDHPAEVRPSARVGAAVAKCHEHASNAGINRFVKRALDIIVSFGALAALSPLFLIVAAAIKLTSRGPVFFTQPRIGRGRRQFEMLKFRTMLENAEAMRGEVEALNNANGISFKVFQDPRVTRLGALLRRTSLDELPQLVNVLRGDMSLVGPRPIPIWVAEQMRGADYVRRFSVMQGLTGLWQIEGRQQDFDYMALQDLRYVDSWTLALDVRILLKTLPAVLRGEGAH